jgi:cytochrome c oxidase cbb3-type subunit III
VASGGQLNGSFPLLSARLLGAAILIGVAASINAKAAAEDSVSRGARTFAAKCERCHGKEGKGDGPDLAKLQSAVSPDDWTDKDNNRQLSDSFIVAMITKGGKANGKSRIMPAFGDKLNMQQVQDLLAFIRSRPE